MNPSNTTLEMLFKDLQTYNPTTYNTMNKISVALIPLGLAVLGILFLVEFTNYSKKFDVENGGMTSEVLMNIALKYLIATFLIVSSGEIIDAIVWFGVQMEKWIHSQINIVATSDAIPQMGKVPFWQRPIVFIFEIFAYLAIWLSEVIIVVLVFLRGVQLYIVKAIAPILLAFFVHDELRSIAVGFFKQVMALVLQGALLVLLIGLIPVLTANDYLSFASFEGGILQGASTIVKNIMIYGGLILKYVAIIILLIGSQGMAKKFTGAM